MSSCKDTESSSDLYDIDEAVYKHYLKLKNNHDALILYMTGLLSSVRHVALSNDEYVKVHFMMKQSEDLHEEFGDHISLVAAVLTKLRNIGGSDCSSNNSVVVSPPGSPSLFTIGGFTGRCRDFGRCSFKDDAEAEDNNFHHHENDCSQSSIGKCAPFNSPLKVTVPLKVATGLCSVKERFKDFRTGSIVGSPMKEYHLMKNMEEGIASPVCALISPPTLRRTGSKYCRGEVPNPSPFSLDDRNMSDSYGLGDPMFDPTQ